LPIVNAPLRELLTWVNHAPRTYGEAMEAWGSHCPRFTVWEDALDAKLVRVCGQDVILTETGKVTLANGR
jgi:hypothetical protein